MSVSDGPSADDSARAEHASPPRVRSGRQELVEVPVPAAEALALAITVVVAVPGDERRVRLVAALEELADVTVVGAEGSDEMAINAALALAPTVTLVDVDPSTGFDGRTVSLVLADKLATSAVVAVTSHEDEALYDALRHGARSMLRPDADPATLAAVVRGVPRGEADLGPGAAAWVLREVDRLAADPDLDEAARPHALSDLEQDVLLRRAGGVDWAAIAAVHQLTRRLVATAAGTALAKVQRTQRLARELSLVRRALG